MDTSIALVCECKIGNSLSSAWHMHLRGWNRSSSRRSFLQDLQCDDLCFVFLNAKVRFNLVTCCDLIEHSLVFHWIRHRHRVHKTRNCIVVDDQLMTESVDRHYFAVKLVDFARSLVAAAHNEKRK